MNRSIWFILFTLMLSIAGCKHDPFVGPTTDNPSNNQGNPPSTSSPITSCNPDTVYFTNTALPLISSNCSMSGCHDAITHRSGYNLTTYSGIRSIVAPGNASGSKLIQVISRTGEEHMPPSPYASLTSSQVNTLSKWINQGAKNNACTSSTCDTTNVTYALSIVPILQNSCYGCHSGTALSGGVNLSTYTGVKAMADNGKLIGTITHASGYNMMPPSGTLQSCDIAEIRTWQRNGALNN